MATRTAGPLRQGHHRPGGWTTVAALMGALTLLTLVYRVPKQDLRWSGAA